MAITNKTLADAIRILAADAVQKAQSGHPGMPMGMADIATVLWREFLRHNPTDPDWQNRDRFILSNGHGSMLHYALLHLSGYNLPLNEIKNFRQFGSQTPGHPELEVIGVETTTGPLGQGLANAVGMAIAERNLGAEFNRKGAEIIDHHTYVFAGDGCLMEGISHEACSLAGRLELNKLICFFDDNGISIDGEVDGWCRDDVKRRFTAYTWEVIGPIDGHSHMVIREAITQARSTSKPTLIMCKTHIGYGSPNKVDKAAAHGSALGEDEIALMRQELGWIHSPFVIPDEIYKEWDMKAKGEEKQSEWQSLCDVYKLKYGEEWKELQRRLRGELADNFPEQEKAFVKKQKEAAESVATRQASQQAIDNLVPVVPELLGGSADLTGSNCTLPKDGLPLSEKKDHGNYIYYGVRELAMSAIMNGIALHGGYIPYGGTFLVFLDYSRSAVRLAALMKQKVIFVFSHDSIGVGEDGPTHQPIEHLAMLRHTPEINVWRPADTLETAVAWCHSLKWQGPSALAVSRQKLEFQTRSNEDDICIYKGGYELISGSDSPQLVVIATGSEVQPAREAVERHNGEGKDIRLVSMPCCEVFARQDEAYQNKVLAAPYEKRLAIEAANPDYWRKYAANTLGISGFGSSAPAEDLFKHFGLDAETIYKRIKEIL